MSNAYGIDKENFESYIDQSLETRITDVEWTVALDEIVGRGRPRGALKTFR